MSVFLCWCTPQFAICRSDGRTVDSADLSILAEHRAKFAVLQHDWVLGSTGARPQRVAMIRATRFTMRLLHPSFDTLTRSIQASARRISRDDEDSGIGLCLVGAVDGRMRAITFDAGEQFQPREKLLPVMITLGAPLEHPAFLKATDPFVEKLQWATRARAEVLMNEMLSVAYECGNGMVGGERFKHTLCAA